MKLTAILPVYNNDTLGEDLERVARALAGQDVHLVGLFSHPTDDHLMPYGARSYSMAKGLIEEHRAKTKQIAEECRRIFDAFDLPAGSTTEWREVKGLSLEDVAHQALFADLVIALGRARDDSPAFDYDSALIAHLIVNTPCSALLLPETPMATPVFTQPVLAWKTSPEASGAARELTRFMPKGTKVELLYVSQTSKAGFSDWSAAEITKYLQRAGLKIEEKVLVLQEGTTAEAINAHAEASKASLIVAGGYGRRRWVEALMGGVTRGLVATSKTPVLFAH